MSRIAIAALTPVIFMRMHMGHQVDNQSETQALVPGGILSELHSPSWNQSLGTYITDIQSSWSPSRISLLRKACVPKSGVFSVSIQSVIFGYGEQFRWAGDAHVDQLPETSVHFKFVSKASQASTRKPRLVQVSNVRGCRSSPDIFSEFRAILI